MRNETILRAEAALDLVLEDSAGLRAFSTDETTEALTDLLTDLRNLCAAKGYDFETALAMSAKHHEAELNGEDE